MTEAINGARMVRDDPAAMERRIIRGMYVTVALAVLVSAPLAPWRVTTGLLLGGVLSLINHHWLRTAVATVFSSSTAGVRPKFRIARYILRYFMIGMVVMIAHLLGIASLVAILVGLCSFVVALLAEAFMQTYFAIVHREEN